MQPFTINSTITVDPQKNLIDGAKLEPRIIKLLLYFVQNRGRLVSRAEIIDKVWDGYAGGEEGMTQAISFLRKALADGEKRLIETVPKGGYVFNGIVEQLASSPTENEVVPEDTNQIQDVSVPLRSAGRRKVLFAVLAGVAFVILVWTMFSRNRRTDAVAPKAPPSSEHAPTVAPEAPQ